MYDPRAQLLAIQNMRRGGGQMPAQSNLAGAMAPVMGAPPPQMPPPQGGGMYGAMAPVMGPPPPQQTGGGMGQYMGGVMGPPPPQGGMPAQRGPQRRRPMGGGL
jgi:hypothetical protein